MAAPKGNKNAKGNKGGRREPIYNKRFAKVAHDLTLLGKTQADIAKTLQVAESTITHWKKTHIEFFESLNSAGDLADTEVAISLRKKAIGYEYTETSETPKGTITHTKHQPPDTAAAIIWLANRQPELWRRVDKTEKAPDSETVTKVVRQVVETTTTKNETDTSE